MLKRAHPLLFVAALWGCADSEGHGNMTGAAGTTGTAGTTGAAGTTGVAGASGGAGTMGVAGTTGAAGRGGTTGVAGAAGTTGVAGAAGRGGTTGVAGAAGAAGAAGRGGTTGTAGAAGTLSASFYIGADITDQEPQPAATRANLLTILKSHGFNYIRLRTFVDPRAADGYDKQNGYGGIDPTVAFGKQVKDAGMGLLIDFHYADNWADPGQAVRAARVAVLHDDRPALDRRPRLHARFDQHADRGRRPSRHGADRKREHARHPDSSLRQRRHSQPGRRRHQPRQRRALLLLRARPDSPVRRPGGRRLDQPGPAAQGRRTGRQGHRRRHPDRAPPRSRRRLRVEPRFHPERHDPGRSVRGLRQLLLHARSRAHRRTGNRLRRCSPPSSRA